MAVSVCEVHKVALYFKELENMKFYVVKLRKPVLEYVSIPI